MPLGPLLGPAQVAQAAEATLKAWLPATVAEVADAHALELFVPRDPEDYRLVATADAVRAVDRVAVAVTSPGLTERPRRSGRGTYDARYALVVSTFVRAADYDVTLRTASAYAVAVRTALLQHPSLGGFASGVEWTGEDVVPVGGDASTTRTLALAVVELDVLVANVADETGAPLGVVTSTDVPLTPRPTL